MVTTRGFAAILLSSFLCQLCRHANNQALVRSRLLDLGHVKTLATLFGRRLPGRRSASDIFAQCRALLFTVAASIVFTAASIVFTAQLRPQLVTLNNPDLILFVGEALVGNESVDQLTKFNKVLGPVSSSLWRDNPPSRPPPFPPSQPSPTSPPTPPSSPSPHSHTPTLLHSTLMCVLRALCACKPVGG